MIKVYRRADDSGYTAIARAASLSYASSIFSGPCINRSNERLSEDWAKKPTKGAPPSVLWKMLWVRNAVQLTRPLRAKRNWDEIKISWGHSKSHVKIASSVFFWCACIVTWLRQTFRLEIGTFYSPTSRWICGMFSLHCTCQIRHGVSGCVCRWVYSYDTHRKRIGCQAEHNAVRVSQHSQWISMFWLNFLSLPGNFKLDKQALFWLCQLARPNSSLASIQLSQWVIK